MLHKLFYPAISDERTWSNLGEHGEHRERREHGKDQPNDLKHSIYDSKHFISVSKHSFRQPDDSKHFILRLFTSTVKKSQHTR